jgi:hypothetical protein
VQPLRFGETPSVQLHVWLGRGDAMLRFLLKHMQHVHRLCEVGGLDGPEGVRPMPLDNLHNPRSSEALQGLGGRIGLTLLGRV